MPKPKEIIGNSEGKKIDLLLNKLPDYIKYRNNELMIEDVSAIELIKEYGTPLFVISEKQVRQNYNKLCEAFSKYPKCLVAYSYKINYSPLFVYPASGRSRCRGCIGIRVASCEKTWSAVIKNNL